MLKKILQLFVDSKYKNQKPTLDDTKEYDWFYEETEDGWVGIRRNTLDPKEKQLLEALFHSFEPPVIEVQSQGWYNFLFSDGQVPSHKQERRVRMIHLHCSGEDWEQKDLELALKGFLSEEIIIFWESPNHAILIEHESHSFLMAENFLEISETFENDLYLRVSFFIGKFQPASSELKELFHQDRLFFKRAIELKGKERVFTFENIFPTLLSHSLPADLLKAIDIQLLQPLMDDPETLATIQVYLENNLNASVTAKKLYIHRNTLQYRVDKFTEKTGVNLKDYPSAITLYIACLLESQKQR
ncbi:PucR family transcriptional regulator [Robertmurraya korlensis]|uniref:PucR family transcriptional regulator n=1 Tax=Robertmurraya korlensis TaxID=519977 RepID=UPI000826B92C|nr:helix-turn-helix domain-containing protein [Robertmurraya korlensis]